MKFNFNINRKIDFLIFDNGYSGFIPSNCRFSFLKKKFICSIFKSVLQSIYKKQFSKNFIKENYLNLVDSFLQKLHLEMT